MKLKLKAPHFSSRTITSGLFLLVVIAEILITFNYLYNNLKPQVPVVNTQKIITADLKGYSQIYTDLNSRQSYEPETFIYKNDNPFKYK